MNDVNQRPAYVHSVLEYMAGTYPQSTSKQQKEELAASAREYITTCINTIALDMERMSDGLNKTLSCESEAVKRLETKLKYVKFQMHMAKQVKAAVQVQELQREVITAETIQGRSVTHMTNHDIQPIMDPNDLYMRMPIAVRVRSRARAPVCLIRLTSHTSPRTAFTAAVAPSPLSYARASSTTEPPRQVRQGGPLYEVRERRVHAARAGGGVPWRLAPVDDAWWRGHGRQRLPDPRATTPSAPLPGGGILLHPTHHGASHGRRVAASHQLAPTLHAPADAPATNGTREDKVRA